MDDRFPRHSTLELFIVVNTEPSHCSVLLTLQFYIAAVCILRQTDRQTDRQSSICIPQCAMLLSIIRHWQSDSLDYCLTDWIQISQSFILFVYFQIQMWSECEWLGMCVIDVQVWNCVWCRCETVQESDECSDRDWHRTARLRHDSHQQGTYLSSWSCHQQGMYLSSWSSSLRNHMLD